MQPEIAPCDGVDRMATIASAKLLPGTKKGFTVTYNCPECGRSLEAETARSHPSQRVRVRPHSRRMD